MSNGELIIIRDTREKNGWHFEPEEKRPGKFQVVNTIDEALDSGDYSIKGLEDVVRIERKAGIIELFNNMIPKANKERFEREMERLRSIKHRYLLIEGQITNDIMGLSVPQLYKGPPGSSVIRWIHELEMEYNIVPMFVGEAGRKMARIIFENMAKRYL
jgi:hypothetical protein